MTTNPDLDQAREWAAEITESRQTNIRPEAFAVARVIQSLPDEWIDADKLREALDWRDSKPSGDDYDGEFYDRLRNLLPPAPLPDPLFGARATHPRHGEGIVISQFPDEDGLVRFVVPDQVVIVDGVSFRWLNPHTLTFHTPDMSKNGAEIDTSTAHVDPIDTRPDHPVFLESEEDYRSAPEGTIVAGDKEEPFVFLYDAWRRAGSGLTVDQEDMDRARRRVLRWRWEA